MMGYYETSTTMNTSPSLTTSDGDLTGSSLVSFDEVEGNSNSGSSPTQSNDPTFRELEAARDALFGAQKLADERAAEARYEIIHCITFCLVSFLFVFKFRFFFFFFFTDITSFSLYFQKRTSFGARSSEIRICLLKSKSQSMQGIIALSLSLASS